MFEDLVKCDTNNVLVSFSGGRTSAYMCVHMLSDPKWMHKNLVFVFANTGKEREETLKFVDECDKQFKLNLVWVEAVVYHGERKGTGYTLTNFENAKRNGEPFEESIKKYGIPNQTKPHCTRELKLRPIHAYMKEHYGKDYVSALGIRFDEMRRVNKTDRKLVYPLIPMGVSVKHIREFWNNLSFDLGLKDYEGNCDLCWKKSKRKKLTLLKENPTIGDWWTDMENKYGEVDGQVYNFHRSNDSTAILMDASKQEFVLVTDPYWKDDENADMDDESSCACFQSEYTDINIETDEI